MPIVMKELESGRMTVSGPIIVCDVCAKRIDRAAEGAAVFNMPFANRQTHVSFVHRGDCCVRALRDKKKTPGLVGDVGLDAWMMYLLRNVELDLGEAKKSANIYAGTIE